MLVARSRSGANVLVASAGTEALIGAPISAPTAELLEAYGARTEDFSSRQATRAMIVESDLVLGVSRAHRDWAVRRHPPALRRTFTLAEFAACVAGSTARTERPLALSRNELVEWASAHRNGPGEDIPDPYLRNDKAHRVAFERIRRLAEPIAEVLL